MLCRLLTGSIDLFTASRKLGNYYMVAMELKQREELLASPPNT